MVIILKPDYDVLEYFVVLRCIAFSTSRFHQFDNPS